MIIASNRYLSPTIMALECWIKLNRKNVCYIENNNYVDEQFQISVLMRNLNMTNIDEI